MTYRAEIRDGSIVEIVEVEMPSILETQDVLENAVEEFELNWMENTMDPVSRIRTLATCGNLVLVVIEE